MFDFNETGSLAPLTMAVIGALCLLFAYAGWYLHQIWRVREQDESRNSLLRRIADELEFDAAAAELPVLIRQEGEATRGRVIRKTLPRGAVFCFYSTNTVNSRGFELNVMLETARALPLELYVWPVGRPLLVDDKRFRELPLPGLAKEYTCLVTGVESPSVIERLVSLAAERIAEMRSRFGGEPAFEARAGHAWLRIPEGPAVKESEKRRAVDFARAALELAVDFSESSEQLLNAWPNEAQREG